MRHYLGIPAYTTTMDWADANLETGDWLTVGSGNLDLLDGHTGDYTTVGMYSTTAIEPIPVLGEQSDIEAAVDACDAAGLTHFAYHMEGDYTSDTIITYTTIAYNRCVLDGLTMRLGLGWFNLNSLMGDARMGEALAKTHQVVLSGIQAQARYTATKHWPSTVAKWIRAVMAENFTGDIWVQLAVEPHNAGVTPAQHLQEHIDLWGLELPLNGIAWYTNAPGADPTGEEWQNLQDTIELIRAWEERVTLTWHT